MNTLETTEQLKQRIIDRCAPKDTARRTELKEMLDALIGKAQESGRIEERNRVVTDGEAVMFVDPDGRPMQPIRGTG